MVESIFSSSIFVDYLLPFILVFTLIFAILQKTKLLGDGKKQIDAIISLVVGLILIAFPYARGIIVLLMPFLAVSAVVLLVFMLLYGFIIGKSGDVLNKGLKAALSIILGLAIITALLLITGVWDSISNFFLGREKMTEIIEYIVLFAAIIGAILLVVLTKSGNSSTGN